MSASDSIWQRLKKNQAANTPAFRKAGIEFERIASLRCPSCAFEENALFWTPDRTTSGSMMLSCPACTHGGARYDLRRNRARSAVDVSRLLMTAMTVLLALSISGGAYVRYAPDTDELSWTVQRTWRQATTATSDVMERVEDALERAQRALRGR